MEITPDDVGRLVVNRAGTIGCISTCDPKLHFAYSVEYTDGDTRTYSSAGAWWGAEDKSLFDIVDFLDLDDVIKLVPPRKMFEAMAKAYDFPELLQAMDLESKEPST